MGLRSLFVLFRTLRYKMSLFSSKNFQQSHILLLIVEMVTQDLMVPSNCTQKVSKLRFWQIFCYLDYFLLDFIYSRLKLTPNCQLIHAMDKLKTNPLKMLFIRRPNANKVLLHRNCSNIPFLYRPFSYSLKFQAMLVITNPTFLCLLG